MQPEYLAMLIGELIALFVAILWTACALGSEAGSKRIGVPMYNVWIQLFSLCVGLLICWGTSGHLLPPYADRATWLFLLLSGVVGFFIGDYCLYKCYSLIGSRFGQLFMTLAPMFSAFAAWVMLGQTLSWCSLLAMGVTLGGIALSVVGRGADRKLSFQLPLKGILLGIVAGICQGVGLIISKLGMDSYQAAVPVGAWSKMANFVPFYSNMIRCIAGLTCFLFLLTFTGQLKTLRGSLRDKKGVLGLAVAVICGPGIGVGFSLLAVQYTSAGIASTLMALTPVLILLPSHLLFKEKISKQSIIGACISVIGVSMFFLL